MVFFAGLPGTGKSLLIHQLAHLAYAQGRTIHLLQWDVARPVFETSETGRRYPQVDGVTHGMIRVAAGRWARDAVRRWHDEHPQSRHLLVGETPFVGHRLVDLARPAADDAESLLAGAATRFVIPVPSREVRAHLEAERERRAARPLHDREREDAPPQVLRALWRDLVTAGQALGVRGATAADEYAPELYRAVYLRILARRHAQALALDEILPTAGFSAYALAIPYQDLLPGKNEVGVWIRSIERDYPEATSLEREIDQWYADPSNRPSPRV
jgi:hypothetical protein